MATKLDHALAHAREGFAVFPLVPNAKRPLIDNWRNLATSNESQIKKWWAETPEANIGIATDQFVVIDIDPRKGGDNSFAALALVEDFPKTRRSETWSGGAHVIYRLPPHTHAKGGANVLGQGLDIRAWGGLIVAPGSTIDDKPYQWGNDRPIATAPKWLIERLKAPRAKSATAGQRIIEEDEIAIARAEQYLLTAPEADEGGRDDAAFKVAARLFDEGISAETCRELLSDWNFNNCHPPLDTSAIERLVSSAARNRTRAIGAGHPLAAGFEPIEIAERVPKMSETVNKPNRLYLVSFDRAAADALTTAAEPLIKGLIDRGAMSVWYGESNSGKTFVALDAAWHIAAGQPWAGMRVRKGAVLYVAPEGGRGIYKRMAALKQSRPVAEGLPLYVVPCPVNLLHPAGVDLKPLAAMVDEIRAKHGVEVELIVIDTLSRALAGGDENSSVDMGNLVKNFDKLREMTEAHVAIVHHTGKDRARGARGHSLLRAATDTEIEIADRGVTVTKQRDLEGDKSFRFKLVPVRLGVDGDGDPVTSCVVDLATSDKNEPAPLAGEERVFAEHLESKLRAKYDKTEESIVGQVFRTREAIKWWAEIVNTFPHEDSRSDRALESEVGRLLLTILKCGWVKKDKKGQWVWANPQNPQNPQN